MIAFPEPRYRIYGSPANYVSVARDALSGRLRSGDGAVAETEKAVAGFVGVAHGICMPQARVGIFLALKALIRPGQSVILSPYTIHDVVNMVICAGGRPVFADIERETCNIDAAQVEALADDGTGAVLVTHLHGLGCDIARIADFCRSRGIALIEDCAQAFGTLVDGRRVGSFGDAGVFSFGMAKNINSFYGGMVVTNDAALAASLRAEMAKLPLADAPTLRQRVIFCLLGDILTSRPVFWTATYWLFRYGYLNNVERLNNQWRGEMNPQRKSAIPQAYLRQMTPMQARLVRRQIDAVDEHTATRLSYARRYHDGLSDIAEIILPPLRDDGSHIYLTFPIQVPDRDALVRHLMENCRDVTVQHITNAAEAECFAEFGRDCPNSRATARSVVLLPCYPSYGMAGVEENVRLVRKFFGR
jgi:perosamine synthetase